jgi:hypothetical protein
MRVGDTVRVVESGETGQILEMRKELQRTGFGSRMAGRPPPPRWRIAVHFPDGHNWSYWHTQLEEVRDG